MSNSPNHRPELITSRASTRSSRPRYGFSILEVTIVAGMTGFLLLMISSVWAGFGRSMADSIAQAKILSESQMAFQTIRRDLRGSLPGTELGPRDQGLIVGRLVVAGTQLHLCYDGGIPNGLADWAAPDWVIRYEVQNGQLVRIDQTANTTFVIANHVQDFQVQQLPDRTHIDLTLEFRNYNRTYSVEVQQP